MLDRIRFQPHTPKRKLIQKKMKNRIKYRKLKFNSVQWISCQLEIKDLKRKKKMTATTRYPNGFLNFLKKFVFPKQNNIEFAVA
jgi:hypothetical protein